MKRLMVVALAIAAMPLVADEETVDGCTWTYRIVNGGAEIYGDEKYCYDEDFEEWDWCMLPSISPKPTGHVTVPSTLGGCPVTGIGEYAFYRCSGMTGVTIPDSVTSIGEYAFSSCSGLTGVTIPGSVTSIGHGAFYGCRQLESVLLKEGLVEIANHAFNECLIDEITLPTTVADVSTAAFCWEGEQSTVTVRAPWTLWNVLEGGEYSGDIVFYGDPPAFHVVTFDVNGGNGLAASEKSVPIGGMMGKLPAPTWSGHLFLGWFTEDGGEPVTATTVLSGDATLHAHWEESPFCAVGGAAPWFVDADGSWRSGDISDDESSWMEVAVTNAPCMVSFRWKASSEEDCDVLYCTVDGAVGQKDSISGMTGWEDVSFLIMESGSHVVRFEYYKDESYSDGKDCGWVKEFAAVALETRTLLLDVNDGHSAALEKNVANGFDIGSLPVPTWGGEGHCLFLGWFTAADGGEVVTGDDVATEELTTLYAHWREIHPPANDNFADASPIEGVSGTLQASNVDATMESGEDNYHSSRATIWFRWTAPARGIMTIDQSGSELAYTRLGVFTGSDVDDLEMVAFNGDPWDVLEYQRSVEFVAEEGETYFIMVGGQWSYQGNIVLNWDFFEGTFRMNVVDGTVTGYSGICPSELTAEDWPDGVTAIGNGAFRDCDSLERVTIPDGVTVIESGAFMYCVNLVELTLPDGPVTIEDMAFRNCVGLADADGFVIVRNTLWKYVGDAESVTIPDGVTSIEASAFESREEPVSVTIPNSVTNIGRSAFRYCWNLAQVFFEGDAPVVGKGAFADVRSDCIALVPRGSSGWDVDIPGKWNGLRIAYSGEVPPVFPPEWQYYSYEGGGIIVTGVSPAPEGEFTIPSTIDGKAVKAIGEEAFCGCSGITGVTIPEGVTRIEMDAFAGCRNLASVTIPDSVTRIEEGAFSGCNKIMDTTTIEGIELVDGWAVGYTEDVPGNLDLSGVRGIGDAAFYWCYDLVNVTIGSDVGNQAFCYCGNLVNVTLGSDVTKIPYDAFRSCDRLASICVAEDNTEFSSANGLLLSKDGTTLIQGVNGDVAIPDCVTNIGNYAFNHRSGLASVATGGGLASIGDYAFAGCRGLTNIVMDSGLTSIGEWAFSECYSLANATIPDSVTHIGSRAFDNCDDSLYDTTTIAGVKLVDGWAVGYTDPSPESLDLTGVRGIGDHAFSDCSDIAAVTIGDGVANIGTGAFVSCWSLASVVIPDSVTNIGANAFNDCSNLSSVTIGNGVTSIGNWAFGDCYRLASVTIPGNVTSIGNWAFGYCSRLAQISFEGNAPTVGDSAFEDVGSGCVVKVRRGSTGWGVAIPGTWHGLRIEYMEDEQSSDLILPVAVDAAPEAVTNAIDDAGFADAAGVKAAIGGSAEEYGRFKAWADRVKGVGGGAAAAGAAAVVANTNAAAAFLLGAERLFENAPTVELGDLSVGEDGTSGTEESKGTISVAVSVKDGEDSVACDAEKVADMFEATSDLGDWDGAGKLAPKVEVIGVVDGKMRFKVTPGDGSASSAFLRIRR